MKVASGRPGFGILASVVLALAVSACGGGAPKPQAVSGPAGAGQLGLSADPSVGAVPVINGPGALNLPLDPYFLSPSQKVTIETAERKAEQACIHRYLSDVALGTYGLPVFEGLSSQPLVYLDPAQAARYGYHDPTVTQEVSAVNLKAAPQVLAVDNGSMTMVNGLRVPPGGCKTVGVDALIKGIPSSLVLFGNGNDRIIAGIARIIDQVVIQSDSRVVSVNRKWSTCITGYGYDFSSPWAAVDDKSWADANILLPKAQRPPITAAEVRTAVADTTCRSRVNLYGIYQAVAAAYQNQWLQNGQNRALAQAQKRADQLMLTRANTVLGG